MPEEINLCFYDIEECGYYDEDDELKFGSVPALLEQLETWAQHGAKPVEHTATFDSHPTILPVYFGALARGVSASDYLLTVWNRTPSIGGKSTASLQGDRPVTAPNVVVAPLPPNGIPGFATYFWVVPEHGLLVTVRFSSPVTAQPGVSLYLKSFLDLHSPHVVKTSAVNPDGKIATRIQGYRESDVQPAQGFIPSFKTSLKKRKGKIEQIRAERHLIRRVIRRSRIDLKTFRTLALFQRARRSLGIGDLPTAPSLQKAKFENQIAMTPTAEELEAIIAKWEAEKDGTWDDVGFEFKKRSGVLWLNRAVIRTKTLVNVAHPNPHFVDVAGLLEEILKQREKLLSEAIAGD